MKTLILPIQLLSKNGRDKLHFRQRHALRKSYEDILTLKYRLKETPQVKQRVTVTRIKGPRERDWDTQNIGAGTAIELLDAMKRVGYFKDDSPEFVVPHFHQAHHPTLKGPCTLIEIEVIHADSAP